MYWKHLSKALHKGLPPHGSSNTLLKAQGGWAPRSSNGFRSRGGLPPAAGAAAQWYVGGGRPPSEPAIGLNSRTQEVVSRWILLRFLNGPLTPPPLETLKLLHLSNAFEPPPKNGNVKIIVRSSGKKQARRQHMGQQSSSNQVTPRQAARRQAAAERGYQSLQQQEWGFRLGGLTLPCSSNCIQDLGGSPHPSAAAAAGISFLIR